MRQANKAVKRERHVTPTVKEMTGDLNRARGFSKLDLNQGYNLLELAPVSRYITTFSTHMGLMRYKRLNFGISSAAEFLQNVIRETLEGIDGAINMSDDILVFGKNTTITWRPCSSDLERKVWPWTRASASSEKTGWNSLDTCSPKTASRQTRSKLQMSSIVRHHQQHPSYAAFWEWQTTIQGSSLTTLPWQLLRKLTHKDQPWCWTEEHDHAVSQLKEAVVSAAFTAYSDPEKVTEISVDASPVGVAAILPQVDPKTEESHVITYASRSFTATEQPNRAGSPRCSLGLWTFTPVHLRETGDSLHWSQAPSVYLWQSEFQAACKNREMGSTTSPVPDDIQVSKRRS